MELFNMIRRKIDSIIIQYTNSQEEKLRSYESLKFHPIQDAAPAPSSLTAQSNAKDHKVGKE
jgi:hypothetical protein